MGEPIDEITIVGGGTAGWLTAVMLATQFGRRPGPTTTVTLIESPNVPTVGVGEATVPAMRELLKQLRIDEAEFFRRCNASFKLGVRFVDWDTDPTDGHGWYDHPFDGVGIDLQGINPGYHFHRFGAAPGADAYGDHISPSTRLIDGLKGPKRIGQGDYEFTVGYAYHLDAGLFAAYLQEIAVARGVLHVRDDVDDVELDEAGRVAALMLRQNGRWPVDMVIDCTGFRGLIIQKALGEPFVSFGDQLMNDRALALQLPHEDATRLAPCTQSTALEAGWSWRVPLHSRVGTGYVFSSAFKTDAQATEEFLRHLGPAAAGHEPRAISMRVGRSRRSWVQNCVAVGLAGGFIEPLESTAIFIVERAVRLLLRNLPDKDFDPALRDAFNRRMETLYAEVRDFVLLHYCTARRADTPYWHAARHDLALPDGLREKLARWRRTLPVPEDFESSDLFGYWSYLIVLFGKGWFDGAVLEPAAPPDEAAWRQYCRWMETEKARLTAALPDHRALLDHIRGSVDEREPARARPAGGPLRATISLPGEALRATIAHPQPQATAQGSLL